MFRHEIDFLSFGRLCFRLNHCDTIESVWARSGLLIASKHQRTWVLLLAPPLNCTLARECVRLSELRPSESMTKATELSS